MISENFPKSGETSVAVMVWMCCHMSTHNCLRCSNTFYMYDIDVGCSFEGSTTSVIVYWDHFHIYIIYMISENFPKSGETSVVASGNGKNVQPYAHPQLFKVFIHLLYVWHRCGMQFWRFYHLSDSVLGSFPHLHHIYDFRELSQIWGNLCGGNGKNVQPYAHPQLFKVFIHLMCMT
jgi:hypothetical protein